MSQDMNPTIEHEHHVRIAVMSRDEARTRYATGTDEGDVTTTAIISICTPGDMSMLNPGFDGRLLGVLHEEFDDVEEGDSFGHPMTWQQAEEIVTFVRRMTHAGCTCLVVHCDAGISRSAGTAAALGLAMGQGDDFVFASASFAPNMTCYRRVLGVAGLNLAEDEIDERSRTNCRLWWEEWQHQDESDRESDCR